MSRVILLGNTTISKRSIEYGEAVKYITSFVNSCISLLMEDERDRFYLIVLVFVR
jgi:hypothetical protein